MTFLLILFVASCSTLHESVGSVLYLGPSRRYDFNLDINDVGAVIGVPGMASHLPEAEPILPGHTLIRPALGMLKSAIKFPHRELEDGAGVNGNYNSLGLKYDGRNDRVMYSGFRRSGSSFDGNLDEDLLENFRSKAYDSYLEPSLFRRSGYFKGYGMPDNENHALDSDEKPSWFRRSGGSRGYEMPESERNALDSDEKPSWFRRSEGSRGYVKPKSKRRALGYVEKPSWFRRSGGSRRYEMPESETMALDYDEKPSWLKMSGGSKEYGKPDFISGEHEETSSAPYINSMADYIMVAPSGKKIGSKPSFSVTNLVLDLENHPKEARNVISERLNLVPKSEKARDNKRLRIYIGDPRKAPFYLTDLFKADTSVLTL